MGGYYKKTVIEEAVEDRGGLINGVLRFSIMWSGTNKDNSDLDAWAKEPKGKEIGYSTGYRKDQDNKRTPMSGQLDVDIITPSEQKYENIVENIAWSDKSKMKPGVYKFWIHQYNAQRSKGFEAEIRFGDELYQYKYEKALSQKSKVQIAEVTLKRGKFTIEHLLEPTKQAV